MTDVPGSYRAAVRSGDTAWLAPECFDRLVEAVAVRVVALGAASRVTTCANPRCARVYVDAHRSKYCSTSCADAHRQARRRSRLRGVSA